MSEREHRRAVAAALTVDGDLRRLFGQLGSAEHPRGDVLRAYRVARRALLAPDGLRPYAVRETMTELRNSVQRTAQTTLLAAATAGATSARRQLEAHGEPVTAAGYDIQPTLAAWMAIVDGQTAAVQAAAATGADGALISGDDEQPGMLAPAPVLSAGAKWLGVTLIGAWWAWVGGSLRRRGREQEYRKQVIAAIDERTTECCLVAHGQVVAMESDFELRGRPRYADRLPWTPFHWYCRSSVALVRRQDAEDGLTQQMIDAAAAELEARRRTGKRVEIHPAHGRSRR